MKIKNTLKKLFCKHDFKITLMETKMSFQAAFENGSKDPFQAIPIMESDYDYIEVLKQCSKCKKIITVIEEDCCPFD